MRGDRWIRWRGGFCGISPNEYTPDHSTISRSRRSIALDTHRDFFGRVLGMLTDRGLLKGKRIAPEARRLRFLVARKIRYLRRGWLAPRLRQACESRQAN